MTRRLRTAELQRSRSTSGRATTSSAVDEQSTLRVTAGGIWYDAAMRNDLVDAVLARLGVERPSCDIAGLRSVYAAWCGAVPFDNTLKLIHSAEALPGTLPGSTADMFFDTWLEYGTGGTCWAGNGALHDLLAELGFDVEPALATMLSSPDASGVNHGSVIVMIDAVGWIADASILSGDPIPFGQARPR